MLWRHGVVLNISLGHLEVICSILVRRLWGSLTKIFRNFLMRAASHVDIIVCCGL